MRFADVVIHLRFPFSFFLAPVALLGLRVCPAPLPLTAVLLFLIVHGLVYTASNAFNSFYDKDTGPIGGIRNPPPTGKALLWTSLAVEAAGVIAAFFLDPLAGLIVLVYGLMSKAYSWDKTRWKRFPVFSLVGICLFQGVLVVFLFAWTACPQASRSALLASPGLWIAMATAAAFLAGVYPLTQIYQHKEDAARGDLTYSLKRGIRGTFLHSGICFALAGAGFAALLLAGLPGNDSNLPPGSQDPGILLANLAGLAACMVPCLVYFTFWWARASRDEAAADFRSTMIMNLLASGGLNLAFVLSFSVARL